MGNWGLGARDWGAEERWGSVGSVGRKGGKIFSLSSHPSHPSHSSHTSCLPHAQCPMPHAQSLVKGVTK
ncbi:hypothetical protein H6H03_02675 [Nostoc paludosum FACHB-159]|uniref:Uncharacterized protein n=1 Tax=Nostoc paludosum FACHB-159 TaxID=2692908 RepID=A0ABR8K155_9NOSO|nr:hypothetical protein [Nostoc paludosum FACHB-159]